MEEKTKIHFKGSRSDFLSPLSAPQVEEVQPGAVITAKGTKVELKPGFRFKTLSSGQNTGGRFCSSWRIRVIKSCNRAGE